MKVILLTDQLIQSDETFIVGGWMQALIKLIQSSQEITIGVVGLTDHESFIDKRENIIYYKIKKQKYNPLIRVINRWKLQIQDEKTIKEYIQAIEDFNPDIVHIFGTENFLCNVIPSINSKVVVHLQGIINPYINAWLPPGISKLSLFLNSFTLSNFIRKGGLYYDYKIFQEISKRELNYFNSIQYVMGRTDWDRAMSSILGKDIEYYDIDEVLRPEFYTARKWQFQKKKKIQLLSILSPSLYKGFDLILKTASILKSKNIPFEWFICGTSPKDKVILFYEKLLKKKYNDFHVIFLGKKKPEKLISHFQNSDIFIHPSYIENSPNSICEAQLLGVPVIAANTGGVSSLVKDGDSGILFPSNDPYYLAEKIISLSSDSEKMEYISENAQKTASQRHDRNNILKEVEFAYNQIIKSQK